MKHSGHAGQIVLSLCTFLCCATVSAQSVVVQGAVSTPTKPVRNAAVALQETTDPANADTAMTDSTGHYLLTITLTSVEPGSSLPSKFSLAQNYPNPFVSATVIPYELKTQADIKVTIYDVLGRVVREQLLGAASAGRYTVRWDGTNARGIRVAPGVYFYRLQAAGESQTKKMVLEGGHSGAPLVQLNPSPSMRAPDTEIQRLTLGGSFTVRVNNTVSTSPQIVSKQIDNLLIQGDTTMNLQVDSVAPPMEVVTLDSVQQVIRGFGAANILPWRPDMTAAQVQTAFGTGAGELGFTILRLRIPSTDNVSDFSANLPTAQLARGLGAIVFASPWSPPPALKTNNNIVGGTLIDTSYASYAAHLKGFADYMASNGVPLYAVSLQNEPDANVTYESCDWSATQFLNFVKNNAPAVGTRIIMPESQNFQHALSDSTLNDSTAAAHVDIIGGHIYGGGLGPYPLAVSKGKDLWMTEHLILDSSWTAALGTGREIHDCMNAGMNAYVWWYIIRYYGPIDESSNVTKRGYVMSQFSKFIRPGYRKILCNSLAQRNVYVSAYKDSASSKVVIVAINTGTSSVQQAFTVTNGSMSAFTPYTTSSSKNCAQGADIPATGGSFTATLDASSVMTFVSK